MSTGATDRPQVLRHGCNGSGEHVDSTAQVGLRDSASVLVRERNERPSASLHARYQPQVGLVHGAPSARDHAPGGRGSSGKVVESDETYCSDKGVEFRRRKRGKSGLFGKRVVLGLVERGCKGS